LTNSYSLVALGASENFYRYAILGLRPHIMITKLEDIEKKMAEEQGKGAEAD
jgi:hypothetical protein